ncbi:hypothetical protein NP233_g10807 [Leucocoprinus birnbaumii]|uniref:Amino acid transporter n=1 Tax=Leucocoprinus birnbaumii TaxID=56174 RepID=A0AAD5VHT2_9AGAR|nr:hypothetical protein NP233_g10807 [Leucocoprinus birnbaumii]
MLRGIVDRLERSARVHKRDDALLAKLGYKSEFRRDFSLWETICFSFSIMAVCASVSSSFSFPLVTALSLAELTSAMPTSAGLYYFSAKLAPPGYGPLVSWITGWANITGQISLICSIEFVCAQLITTGIQVGSDGRINLGPGPTFGILIALLVSHAIR